MSCFLYPVSYCLFLLLFPLQLFCQSAHGNLQSPLSLNTVFFTKIESTGKTAFAPCRYGDKIYFTSLHKKEGNHDPALRIFSKSDYHENPVVIEANPNKERLNAANISFTPDGKRMYYTICKDEVPQMQRQCTIWSRDRLYEGGWEAASKLPPCINQRGFTATQPSIGYNWSIKKYVLFFVSDRPGGKGGTDIWCSEISLDGEYGEPYSLPFNTDADEITPSFYLPTQTLYFSSNGPNGRGGFDIYDVSMSSEGKWEQPENAGEIINSAADDLYFTFHHKTQIGYFASNRDITEQDKSGIYALDLYQVYPSIKLKLPVYNAANGIYVEGAIAEVFDENDGVIHVFKEQPFDRNLKVYLRSGKDYYITILKSGFEAFSMEVNTEGLIFPAIMRHEIVLFPLDPESEKPNDGVLPVNLKKSNYRPEQLPENDKPTSFPF